MVTCVDVKFIFDSVCLGFFSSANIFLIAVVALRVVLLLAVFAMFLAIISPSSSCSSYT